MNARELLESLIDDMLRARGRYSGTTQTWSIATDPDIARPLLQKLLALLDAAQVVSDECESVIEGHFRDGTPDGHYRAEPDTMEALSDALDELDDD